MAAGREIEALLVDDDYTGDDDEDADDADDAEFFPTDDGADEAYEEYTDDDDMGVDVEGDVHLEGLGAPEHGVLFLSQDGEEQPVRQEIQRLGIEELRQLLTYGLASFEPEGAASEMSEDDEDDDFSSWRIRSDAGTPSALWDPVSAPVPAGQELALSGYFGQTQRRPLGAPASAFAAPTSLAELVERRKTRFRGMRKVAFPARIPNSRGVVVAQYAAPCYSGQYSEDASFFYTCNRDMRVHIYDTTVSTPGPDADARRAPAADDDQVTSMKLMQTVDAERGQWTITDVNLSPDNQWIIYSSISPFVGLSPVRPLGSEDASNQVSLDFRSNTSDHFGVRPRAPSLQQIWSIRFSGDSREILAGAHYGSIYVYDVEAQRRVLHVTGHDDDVNSVSFADEASSNVFVSGSDDSLVKVWDRRSLVRGKPAGMLPGHTEGITYISSRGDGRYCISNSKDQSVRLWDLRSLRSTDEVERWSLFDYGLRNWDYRYMPYRRPRYYAHPADASVMTYRGHSVLRTLIRCYFSPRATTGQKYIYSGSADGRIHVWSLDGQVAQVIDRNETHPLYLAPDGPLTDPSAPEWALPDPTESRRARAPRPSYISRRALRHRCIVRDVSWHAGEPTLMSTAWDGPDGSGGTARRVPSVFGTLAAICPNRTRVTAAKFVALGITAMNLQRLRHPLHCVAPPRATRHARALATSCRTLQEDAGKTHFGFRTIEEGAKVGLVGSVFSSVASSYDMMNDAMSFGVHRLWKNHFVESLNPRGGIACLDVAGGTGDIALRILDHARTRHCDRETSVTVLDINPSMLNEGQKRVKETMYWGTPQIQFQLGNAEALDCEMDVPPRANPSASTRTNPILPPLVSEPVPSGSKDLYTIAFGIRNCTHIDRVIQEAYRVLKPGGIFACLEFGKVSVPLLGDIYKQYSFHVIPPVGQLLAGDRDSYQYLVESIERFPKQADFAAMIADAGFLLPGTAEADSMGLRRLSGPAGAWEDLTFGVATIWTGYVEDAVPFA
ncbi:hypothetical protein MSPP1_000387 [Malassezia sp. CBS 17886]|nr:hypothetical protein MSPP1_000387 [Malassezia sp. CBS 17886]